jgi:hypothetical protein
LWSRARSDHLNRQLFASRAATRDIGPVEVYRAHSRDADEAAMASAAERGQLPLSSRNVPHEPALDRPDRVDAIIDFLSPTIEEIVARLAGDEFTTIEFIDLMRSDPQGSAAYDEALRRWGESERYAKMVIHGQVIPGILRRSDRLEWLGFAYGEDDPYAVPARWRLKDK